MTDEAVVRVEEASIRYDRNLVIDRVSFEVARGSVYALLGRNGAGKSSLIRCLLGLQKVATGKVRLFGHDVWAERTRVLARTAYVHELDALRTVGVDGVFSGEGEVALAMTEFILRSFGASSEQIDRERERVRSKLFDAPKPAATGTPGGTGSA